MITLSFYIVFFRLSNEKKVAIRDWESPHGSLGISKTKIRSCTILAAVEHPTMRRKPPPAASRISAVDHPSISPAQVAAYRLQRHHLRDEKPRDVVTIARDICGIQAQVMSAAYLQFWVRNHSITRIQVEGALWKTRSLVKTSLMRQTLHIIPADEFPLCVSAMRSTLLAYARRIMARFKIGVEEGEEVARLIVETLSSGPLSRAAITAAIRPKVSKRVRAWMENVWSVLRVPIAEGQVCYGPGEGNQVKFIRVDQWLPKLKPIPEAEAQGTLLRKYLKTYGPATIHDFAHWSGISMAICREIYGELKDELQQVTVNGESCTILRKDLAALAGSPPPDKTVRLLPLFDPYLLAHAEKDHLIEKLHYKRVYRNQGWISAVILLKGRIAGTWSYRFERRRMILLVEPFGNVSSSVVKRVRSEAESVAGFFAKEVEVQVKDLKKGRT